MPSDYILGCRPRTDKAVRDGVLADPRPFRRLADGLEVKDVRLGARRYVVCRNPIEAERDARMRDGIIDRPRATPCHGPKAVVGSRGFARFLTMDKGAVATPGTKCPGTPAAIEADARFDGVFVLRTNTDQPADEVNGQRGTDLCQKRVERRFAPAPRGLRHERLEFGTMAEELSPRVQRDVRFARIAIAQNCQAYGRHCAR